MSYTITKTFRFEAAHWLPHVPEGHKCRRVHGHNYEVVVELESDFLDSQGFVWDYGSFTNFKAYLREHLDHRTLNDVGIENPTAERLAHFLAIALASTEPYGGMVRSVTVKETPDTSATYHVS